MGPEDRNGTRNFDEIRFWADYVVPSRSGYIYDDDGNYGGLSRVILFVIAGDQNSDPLDGDSIPGCDPATAGAPAGQHQGDAQQRGRPRAGRAAGCANDTHLSDPAFDTADFSDFARRQSARRLCAAAQEPAHPGCGRLLAA